jgi:hypothetical protein
LEAARAASTLAISSDPTKIEAATTRFRELYFGELVVVEDRRVELAMIAFESCLEQTGCIRRDHDQHGNLLTAETLATKYGPAIRTNLSLELSACIRTALQQDRGIQFGNTANAQTTCPYD